ncbi:MAG: Na+/H+ antiporter [Acidobacteriota bacterium]
MSGIGDIELILLLLLLLIAAFGLLAQRLGLPYPIVMVVGGLLISFVPGIPNVRLHPDLVFLVVLPPVLYMSAWTTSWRDFRYNIVSILLLAFGLVGFTVTAVALVAPLVFEGFDWRLGFVLGAIVAPTDAIAATSIARRIGLPRRIVDVLEGESLVNDASGLLALQFATGIMVRNQVPTLSDGLGTLVWLIAGGILLGLAVGWFVDRLERLIEDGPIEITISILIPYAVYLAADRIGASGVLAVVSCGLFLSRRSSSFFSPEVRLRIWSVWESLNFVLNGFVFILIGFQLPAIRSAIQGHSLPRLLLEGAIFSGLLILLRLVWVFPGTRVAWLIRRHIQGQKDGFPPLRNIFVLGWTGMRGIVSLAAALALPAMLADGTPFPNRDMMVFLTFSLIFVTLVLQGITLPPLIRSMGLAGAAGPNCEELEARRIVIAAAVSHLESAKEQDNQEYAELYEDLTHHYAQRLASLQEGDDDDDGNSASHGRHIELTLEALRVERETAIRLRDEGRINDEVLRRLERELDLNESRIVTIQEE